MFHDPMGVFSKEEIEELTELENKRARKEKKRAERKRIYCSLKNLVIFLVKFVLLPLVVLYVGYLHYFAKCLE